jgi:hypothetical protein
MPICYYEPSFCLPTNIFIGTEERGKLNIPTLTSVPSSQWLKTEYQLHTTKTSSTRLPCEKSTYSNHTVCAWRFLKHCHTALCFRAYFITWPWLMGRIPKWLRDFSFDEALLSTWSKATGWNTVWLGADAKIIFVLVFVLDSFSSSLQKRAVEAQRGSISIALLFL